MSPSRSLLVLAAALSLTGCYSMTSFAKLDRALPTFQGRPVADVVNYLGYPSSERTTMGKKIYVWSTAFTQVLPSTTSTTGTVGGTPVTVNSTGMRSYDLACEIRVITVNDIVESFEYEGNNGACARYSRALEGRIPRS